MTDDVTLDTSIPQPGLTAGEVEMLLFALDRSRATFAWKVGGLGAEALHREHPPSVMTLARLIRHLSWVEALRRHHVSGEPLAAPWGGDDDPDEDWSSADGQSPAELYTLWRDEVSRSRAAWRAALAKADLDQPSHWLTASGKAVNLRRVLVDLNDEYARHVGHADLMREAVDGLVGEDPPQG